MRGHVPNSRAEDLAFMAQTGETADGAAERLGVSYDALEKWAHRHVPDVWAVLVSRRAHIGVTSGRNQYSA